MEHLWRTGPSTVGDVLEALNWATNRKLAYTTVMTILVRLAEKAYVTRTLEGRQFRYSAAFPEEALQAEIGRRELRRLVERHGAATLAGVAADLVGADADLAIRLRAMADRGAEG